MEYDYVIKTIIIGDSNVGKSNILTKFVDNEFNSKSYTTIGVDYKIITFNYENKNIKLVIWDTAGQERFKSIVKTFYNCANVVIICFDLTDKTSFENIDYWYNEVIKQTNQKQNTNKNQEECKEQKPIIILVGTKCDKVEKIVIEKEEGIKKAIDLKLFGYFECSAKENICIEEIFLNLIKIYCSFDEIQKIKKSKKLLNNSFNSNNENYIINLPDNKKKNKKLSDYFKCKIF